MTDEEKMKAGLYEDAPVIRLRIVYILKNFDISDDVRKQLEDIWEN